MMDDSVFGDANVVPIEMFDFAVIQNDVDGKEICRAELKIANGMLHMNYTGDVDKIDYAHVLNELLGGINNFPLFFKTLNDMGHKGMCDFLKARNGRLN